MIAARGSSIVVLMIVLMASSTFSEESWSQTRVKRDKGGHHHQEVGRQRQLAITGDHRYGSHVVAPFVRPTALIETESVRAITNNNVNHQQFSGPPTQRLHNHHFRHPTRRPDHQHKRMVLPAQRRPINANQLSHGPIGPTQHYAPQQPPQSPRPAYLPAILPIYLRPSSIILPSPPTQSYQQLSGYASAPVPQSQPSYNQAPPPAQYQPAPPSPVPQQPQYQQPQYQPPPPPPPAPSQPQPQYQPPPPPPQQQPAAPPASYQSAPPAVYNEAPLPVPLYARQPQQNAAPESYNQPPQQDSTTAAYYEISQQQEPEQAVQSGGYSNSEHVTVPPVIEESASYSTYAPVASADQDIQTNTIGALPVPPPPGSVVATAVAAVDGGKKEEESQWSEGSIPWKLEKLGLNTLNDLLVLSGLDEMFDKEGPFTVFVPVDQAFEILIQKFGGMEKASEEFNKNPDVLNSLLKHHVVAGSMPSSSLQNNGVMQSLLTTPLRVKFYESEDSEWRPLKVITVNGARVVKPDIQATNGVIHIVDRVLFPVPQADIYNTLKNDPAQRYTTLISAIDKAGLTTVLANPTGGPYTVFAPTNKAFSLISRSELNAILNDPAKLTKLLQRHVVQDLIYTSGLQGFQKAYALDFEILYIYHAKGMTKVNGANVIDQDNTTLNGVIHTIDSVLGLY